MARLHYFQYILDNKGNPLTDAEVRIYLSGTSIEANIYTHPIRGTQTISSTAKIKTNDQGFFEVWLGDSFEKNGGYPTKQKFKVTWTKYDNDHIVILFTRTINNLTVYDPLFPVNENDYDERSNKVISNYLAKKLESHVESIVPSAAPHNIVPYNVATDIYDPLHDDSTCNKVISNRLAFQMWNIATKSASGTLSIDTSAARYHIEYSPPFTLLGGLYYTDITHGFNNLWPLVVVIFSRRTIVPEKVISLNANTTRVFLDLNLSLVNILILG